MPGNCENFQDVGTLQDVADRARKPRKKKAGELKVRDPLTRAMIDWVMEEAEARGWSNLELAKRCGIPDSSISFIYRGERSVNTDHWCAFAKAFGLSVRHSLVKLVDFMERREAEGGATSDAGDQELLDDLPDYDDDGKYARKKTPAKGVSVSAPPESTRPPR